jgi:small subunit ribosomal protein S4
MARYTGNKCKLCRREGMKLFLKGQRCFTDKCAIARRDYPPGVHAQKRTKVTEYGVRLREKQKLKRIYGVHEKGFRRMFELASRQKGNTGQNLLVLFERRLDNVLYAMGFGSSRAMSRQLVRHGHVRLNGRRATVPSMLVDAGDVVTVSERDKSRALLKTGLEMSRSVRQTASWVSVAEDQLQGQVVSLPRREDVPYDINELFVVEVASR